MNWRDNWLWYTITWVAIICIAISLSSLSESKADKAYVDIRDSSMMNTIGPKLDSMIWKLDVIDSKLPQK
jgi:hypothetical protein